MGRWIQRYDYTSVKGIFWRSYIIAIIFSWVALLTNSSVKYSNESKNKSKIVGCILGFAVSIILYGIFMSIVARMYIVSIILVVVGVPLSIIATMIVYKKIINRLVQEDQDNQLVQTLLILEELKNRNLITEEYYIQNKQKIEESIVDELD